MIWQFDHRLAEPRYWIDERAGRERLHRKTHEQVSGVDFEYFRLGFRDVASNTNERFAIATILPRRVFAGNTLPVHVPTAPESPENPELVVFLSIFNSFVFDWMIRKKITYHLNMFYIYQMPVPRLNSTDNYFDHLLSRSGKLVCTTREFDLLARELGLKDYTASLTEESERIKLRAEIDGLVAHLYELTEEELKHILSTFPLTPDPVKVATLNAYRDVERGLIR